MTLKNGFSSLMVPRSGMDAYFNLKNYYHLKKNKPGFPACFSGQV